MGVYEVGTWLGWLWVDDIVMLDSCVALGWVLSAYVLSVCFGMHVWSSS